LIGLKIAIRYGHQRRQFKPEGALEEIPIINYLTHQRRLYPPLAASFAYHFALKLWREKFLKPNKTPEDEKEIHLLAAGLKRTLQTLNSSLTTHTHSYTSPLLFHKQM
jgi:acyl-CoA oxidase